MKRLFDLALFAKPNCYSKTINNITYSVCHCQNFPYFRMTTTTVGGMDLYLHLDTQHVSDLIKLSPEQYKEILHNLTVLVTETEPVLVEVNQ